jgi:Fe-S-cluster containining protein
MNSKAEELLPQLAQLYRDVHKQTARLDVIHSQRLQCRLGCTACCVDGITVFEIEAENIRRHHADLLKHGTPHSPGACAFLDDEGACRIYEHRPYVCRTQGYPLRWLDEGESGTVEMRDICPLNETDEPIEELPGEICWSIGPFEERLARLQVTIDGGKMNRIALRDLLNRQPGT